MARRVLLIAYYFPPLGLSGVQRVAKFTKYLPEFGWDVSVLTVHPRSYFAYDPSMLDELRRPGITIHRTASIDPTRLLRRKSIELPSESRRRKLSILSQTLFQPDNKIGWYPFAVRAGKEILESQSHDVILSSAPPYTAHLIGAKLANSFGLPLLLDYRDDWLDNPRHNYPTGWHRSIAGRMEERVLRASCQTLSINDQIRYRLSKRGKAFMSGDQHAVISHGYDPEDFSAVEKTESSDRMNIVYTGIFYDAQKPDVFLRGLARFIAVSPDNRKRVQATFCGLLPEQSLKLIDELGISDCVDYRGYVSHGEAVSAMKNSDVLWMTIGRRAGASGISTGKLYEYFGSRKPILGMVPEGVARKSLEEYGAAELVEPDDPDGVAVALGKLFMQWNNGLLPEPSDTFVLQYDRRELASKLAVFLNNATKSDPS